MHTASICKLRVKLRLDVRPRLRSRTVIAMETEDMISVRVTVDLSCCGLVTVKVAFQTSDDGMTWPASTTNPPQFALAPATAEGTTYEDISASLTKKYVRFGVWVYNALGSLVELCLERLLHVPLRSRGSYRAIFATCGTPL